MAAARHNRPTIIIYGGTIQPGIRHVDCPSMGFKKGGTSNISDAFESYGNNDLSSRKSFLIVLLAGAYVTGKITDEQRFDVVRHACPGAGACGGMYTYASPVLSCIKCALTRRRANTMSSALEAIGMSLPYSSSTPALYPG
jgi:dihydroxy-acid dehydratase